MSGAATREANMGDSRSLVIRSEEKKADSSSGPRPPTREMLEIQSKITSLAAIQDKGSVVASEQKAVIETKQRLDEATTRHTLLILRGPPGGSKVTRRYRKRGPGELEAIAKRDEAQATLDQDKKHMDEVLAYEAETKREYTKVNG